MFRRPKRSSAGTRNIIAAMMLSSAGVGCLVGCAVVVGLDGYDVVVDASEGGPNDSSEASSSADGGPNNADGNEGPCVGEGCPCTATLPCLDSVYAKCISGVCGQCTTDPDTCPPGNHCLVASHRCTPGCKSDDECKTLSPNAPLCDLARHECVECKSKAECPATNQDCSPAGVCADKCTPLADGGPQSCGTSKLCCGGLCIDPLTDVFNCKQCGVACTGGTPACCAGKCADTQTSVANCGGCGTQCVSVNSFTTSCSAGSCNWTCFPGFNHCQAGMNSGCETNTATSPSQCGSCTTNCNTTVLNATQIGCSNGKCTFACNANFASCDNVALNGCECACGAVGQICCPNGVCTPTATTRCSGGNNRCEACVARDAPCNVDNDCCSRDCRAGPRTCR